MKFSINLNTTRFTEVAETLFELDPRAVARRRYWRPEERKAVMGATWGRPGDRGEISTVSDTHYVVFPPAPVRF